MFRIGQKVVCVSLEMSGGGPLLPGFNYPSKGGVYTIRGIFPAGVENLLLLEEVVNRPCGTTIGFLEPGFNATHFRPVVEKKTDISVFEEILRRETVDDRAPANVHERG